MKNSNLAHNMAIYIHIPFCKKRCQYCSFISSENAGNNMFNNYFNALNTEILLRKDEIKNFNISSVYFGGGTPTFPPARYIEEIMLLLKNNFVFCDNAEISIEANPGTLTGNKAETLLKSGINRFSIGLQSSNDTILNKIGRIHNLNDYKKSIELLRKFDVKNISTDIMLGLPMQTMPDVEDTLNILREYSIPHISAYGLKVEEGTMLYNLVKKGELTIPDEDLCADMYEFIYSFLEKNNVKRYEISNFAIKGYECRHNLTYWKREPYAGFGAAAHSFLNGERFFNTENIEKYIDNNGKDVIFKKEKNSGIDAEFEYIMLGLRLSEGINLENYKRLFNREFTEKYSEVLKKLNAFFDITENNIKVKESGFYVMNSILTEFVPEK